MNRRNFLKLLGIAPVAPSVLAVLPKKQKELTEDDLLNFCDYDGCSTVTMAFPLNGDITYYTWKVIGGEWDSDAYWFNGDRWMKLEYNEQSTELQNL